MAFRFPLAAVLRLREIHEQREERLLTQILTQMNQARETIVSLDEQIAGAAIAREAALRERMSVAELHAAYGMEALLKERRAFTEQQLAQFTVLRDKQIQVYQAAHRDREVLSKMWQQQKDAFAADLARREQKSLDDLFLSRRLRK